MPHPYFGSKYGIVTSPQAISDNSIMGTTEIDTAGYDYLKMFVILGATDIAMVSMRIQESDVTASGMADVTGLIAVGTTGNERLPTATDDNKIFAFFVDLKARKRFIDPIITTGDGTAGSYVAVIYELCRAKESGTSTASTMGLGGYFDV